ncbi:hypothetical protein BO71DRAFT_126540 [Aspergillus ellipticus CBS 707.79]|uniref:DUF3752 domain-containing protein n=1 Tax=Aspergillus ellipticus CBS 707.79 TaxID=1448320 RepID=A0A319DJ28_9EURO|nr:hypothetical protein BO71DRAFT_126540 [Aspergillus ellipticus CBS 707.79]
MDNEKRKYGAAAGTSPSDDDASKRRKVIGPAMPPTAEAADNNTNSDSDDDSSDDDDFGPSLPPPEGTVPTTAPTVSVPASKEETPKAPQRDAWMLEPIDGSNRSSRVDPTKLRNRKFQTGRAANATPGGGGVDVSWTETPEQKMKRLQDEVLGVNTRPNTGESAAGSSQQPSRAMQEKVRRYNEEKRKEEAAARVAEGEDKKKKEEEDDDPSSRAFDKEKDMGLSSRITHAQRREMMNKASDFGSRFTSGKFL